jgi:hypothetical protein
VLVWLLLTSCSEPGGCAGSRSITGLWLAILWSVGSVLVILAVTNLVAEARRRRDERSGKPPRRSP